MWFVLQINDKNAEYVRVLSVSMATVYNYRVQGNLTGKVITNGLWNYDEDVVYKILNDDVLRRAATYF
jgi:predicted site-specific integrase-resolvase